MKTNIIPCEDEFQKRRRSRCGMERVVIFLDSTNLLEKDGWFIIHTKETVNSRGF